jgi:hypothetical protein
MIVIEDAMMRPCTRQKRARDRVSSKRKKEEKKKECRRRREKKEATNQ